jgi:hypothetical protein
MLPVNALELARIAIQDRIALGLPAYKNPIEKSKENPLSFRKAINAKCFECVGAGQDANYRNEIRNCTSYTCPLHQLRPYSRAV